MINTTEYRIGNIVCWNPTLTNPGTTIPKVYMEIASIDTNRIGYFAPGLEHRSEAFMDDLIQTNTAYKEIEELEAVSISEKLLSEAIAPELLTSDLAEKNIIFSSSGQCFMYGDTQIGKRPQYLHELQNLYYALTGKELQVNLQSLPL